MEPAPRRGAMPRHPGDHHLPTPPARQACYLLVLPVVVAVVATDVLNACQKVVQELKQAQGQVKPHCRAPSLPRPLKAPHRPPFLLALLSLAL